MIGNREGRMKKLEKQNTTKQRILYLSLVLGTCYLLFGAALLIKNDIGHSVYGILQKGFTAFPVLAALITRKITKDKSPWRFSLKVWKRPWLWLFCAFVPGILIALGAGLYFMIFPEAFSGSFHYGGLFALAGAEADGVMQLDSPVQFWIVTIAISAAFIPIQLLELGEEIGWREYLLPKQIERYGLRRAVLVNGLLWGIAHMPLIYFGFNYSLDNPGAPWSNMVMMLLVCMTLGIILSYVMVISGNVMYPAIVHGVVNVIGEVAVYLSVTEKSGLLGPNPTGLIGMSGLILCAAMMFCKISTGFSLQNPKSMVN